MVVVSDSGPPIYLMLVGQIQVLPVLYQQVIIPSAVRTELLHAAAPESVRQFMLQPPEWVNVSQPTVG